MIRIKYIKNIGIAISCIVFQAAAWSQMGIGISVPHNSAGLEISASNKGLLIPRVALLGPSDGSTIPFGAPAGLLVFNTNAAMAGGGGVGFYYNANEGNPGFRNWVKMQTGLSDAATWNLSGNAGISAATHFLGTTDNTPLVFANGDFQAGNIRKIGFLIPQEYSYYFSRSASKLTATAHFCVGIGSDATGGNNIDDARIGIGRRANFDIGSLNKGSFSVAIGDSALTSYRRANGAVLIGKNAGKLAEYANENTGIGFDVLKNTVAELNTGFGSSALRDVIGEFVNIGVGNAGFLNVAFGYSALQNGTTIQRNVAVGSETGGIVFSSLQLVGNIMVGAEGLKGSTAMGTAANMNYNVAIGYKALANARTANNNVTIGNEAMLGCGTCTNNVALGFKAMTGLSSGTQNTVAGASAAAILTTGGLNTAAGTGSLGGVTTGSFNTAIGFLAYPTGNFSNSTVIGYFRNVAADNQVRFGNTAVTSIGGQVGWTALSDARAKTHIQEDVPGIEFIGQLNPVSYRFNRTDIDQLTGMDALRARYRLSDEKQDDAIHTGLEAQKVFAALQKFGVVSDLVDVPETKEGLYGIRYGLMVVPLVKTIQKQQELIDHIQRQIEESEKLLSTIHIMNAALK
jgi:trimeric autotransporter adhesin